MEIKVVAHCFETMDRKRIDGTITTSCCSCYNQRNRTEGRSVARVRSQNRNQRVIPEGLSTSYVLDGTDSSSDRTHKEQKQKPHSREQKCIKTEENQT